VNGGKLDDGVAEPAVRTGWRLDVEDGSWAPMPVDDAPEPRTGTSWVWTGDELVVFGGSSADLGSGPVGGGVYRP